MDFFPSAFKILHIDFNYGMYHIVLWFFSFLSPYVGCSVFEGRNCVFFHLFIPGIQDLDGYILDTQ